MQLYAITDRRRFGPSPAGSSWDRLNAGEEAAIKARLAQATAEWSRNNVQFIQLREKDLDAPGLHLLARQILERLDRLRSKLLINAAVPGFVEVALAVGADGVHIPGRPRRGAARHARRIFDSTGRRAIVSMACHTLEEIEIAKNEEADLVLYSPIFEKEAGLQTMVQGLEGLRRACIAAGGMPVFALGGVTVSNAGECLQAGAQGVAGIRLFAGDGWRSLARSEPGDSPGPAFRMKPPNHI